MSSSFFFSSKFSNTFLYTAFMPNIMDGSFQTRLFWFGWMTCQKQHWDKNETSLATQKEAVQLLRLASIMNAICLLLSIILVIVGFIVEPPVWAFLALVTTQFISLPVSANNVRSFLLLHWVSSESAHSWPYISNGALSVHLFSLEFLCTFILGSAKRRRKCCNEIAFSQETAFVSPNHSSQATYSACFTSTSSLSCGSDKIIPSSPDFSLTFRSLSVNSSNL